MHTLLCLLLPIHLPYTDTFLLVLLTLNIMMLSFTEIYPPKVSNEVRICVEVSAVVLHPSIGVTRDLLAAEQHWHRQVPSTLRLLLI